MIFMQGKRGGTQIYACILGSFVIQRGEGSAKNVASKREN